MRYLIFLMLFMTIYTNKLQAETQQEVVNDTLWTCMPQIDGTYSTFRTYSKQHNLFYATTSFDKGKHFYVTSYSLDDGREVTRKYFDSTLFRDARQVVFGCVYYESEGKVILSVQDTLYFLDPVTLDLVRKVKLPPFILTNGEEFNGYSTNLNMPGIYISNKYLVVDIKDKSQSYGIHIYDIEKNEYLKYNAYGIEFNEDESLLLYGGSGFRIYKTSDWTELYSFETAEVTDPKSGGIRRHLTYNPYDIAYSPDKSRIALAVFKESVLGGPGGYSIDIFNLNTENFEESISEYNTKNQIEGLLFLWNERVSLHFVDNETLIISGEARYQGIYMPILLLYKFNTNENFVMFPWQWEVEQRNVKFDYFINLSDNDILCKAGNLYVRLDIRPELLTSVEESHSTLYPNPSNGLVNIQLNSISTGNTNWQLINTSGNIILNGNQILHTGINQFTINISGVPIGQYILSFTGAVNTTYNIIKE